MTRILLFLLFFMLLAADTLGLNPSLAPGLSVKNAFLYLIFFLIATDTALKRNRRFELMSVIAPYSLSFFYATFSVVFVVLLINYPNYRLVESLISLKGGFADNLLVLLVFFYGVLTPKDSFSLLKLMIWAVVVANLVTVIDAFNIPDLGIIDEREDGRIGGPIGEANQYAAFLALFLPATIALVMLERGLLRLLAVIGVSASLLALLITASRGGFVGVVVGAAFAAFYLREYVTGKAVMSTLAAGLALSVAGIGVLIATGYGDLLYDRFIGMSTGGNTFDVSSGRNYIWGTAFAKMFEQPISLVTGYGWNTYFQFRVFRFAPHNSYLMYFFELGAIGLVLILAALANVLRVARRALSAAERETSMLLLAFVVGLISLMVAIFFVDISSVWLFVWAFVGTAMRLALMQEATTGSPTAADDRVATSPRFARPR